MLFNFPFYRIVSHVSDIALSKQIQFWFEELHTDPDQTPKRYDRRHRHRQQPVDWQTGYS